MVSGFEEKLKAFGVDLYKINAIKFGEFETKSGLLTPVYLDLRVIVSYPKLLDTLADLINEFTEQKELSFDIICGVPYTALPIATVVSMKKDVPMVTRRKEKFGGARIIEGQFKKGANCLIIEDVVTSGGSVLETAKDLKYHGINCEYAVVLLNREQGGRNILEHNGIKMHALLDLTQLMEYLEEAECIGGGTVETVKDYLETTQVGQNFLRSIDDRQPTFEERSKITKNSIAKRLFQIMETKKTNLCVSVLLTNYENFCELLHKVGPHICLLITFVEAMGDFDLEKIIKFSLEAADKYNFLICEDKKFSDIGKTVQLQYSNCLYKTSLWAHAVTAHSLMGKGVLNGIKNADGLPERGVFLIAETNSSGNLMDENYTKATVKLAKEYPDLVTGIDCQSDLIADQPEFIQLIHEDRLDFVKDSGNICSDLSDYLVLNKCADIVVAKPITSFDNIYEQSAIENNVKLAKGFLYGACLKRNAYYNF